MTVPRRMGPCRRLLTAGAYAFALFSFAGVVNGCGTPDCNDTATCPVVGDDVGVTGDVADAGSGDAVGTTDTPIAASDASVDVTDGDVASDGGFEGSDETTAANDSTAADGNDGAGDGPPPADADAGVLLDTSVDAPVDAPPDAPKCRSSLLVPTAAVASSSTTHLPGEAIDGSFSTRWESMQGSDPQWIYVDFGAPVFVNRVQIAWLSACGKDYDLQVSNDKTTWTTIRPITGNAMGGSPTDWPNALATTAVDHQGLSGFGRYLRIFGRARCNNSFGYSMWEMRFFGDTNAACSP